MTKRIKRTEEVCQQRGVLAANAGLIGFDFDAELSAERWLREDVTIARQAFNKQVEKIVLG